MKETTSLKNDLSTFGRGFLMGVADVVPGVSGGTVALLTGIYPRLINALAGCGSDTIRRLLRGRWSEVAVQIDLRFLFCLGLGIGTGLILTILTVVRLLKDDATRPHVLAAFLGMLIAGTALMAYRLVANTATVSVEPGSGRLHPGHWGWAMVGFALALGIALGQQAQPITEPSLPYLFLCAVVGISAMILPGISGAMLLLLMGVYGFLVHIPEEILHGQNVVANFIYLLTFAAGCLTGLLTTTKVLKWLLQHWPIRVTCFLFGLMVGTIPCLWPFQINRTPEQPKLALRIYENRWPEVFSWSDGAVCLTAVLVGVAIFGLSLMASHTADEPKSSSG
jgi:putative membrane protein